MSLRTTICKVDDELGVVFGWAIICNDGGEPYVDSQDDHIPEDAMLKATIEFMEKHRSFKAMHEGDAIGSVVCAFPLTTELAKAFEIETEMTGLMIGVKPANREVFEKFKSGEYSGFSIGGVVVSDKEMKDG